MSIAFLPTLNEGNFYLKEVMKLEIEPITVDPEEVLRISPVFPVEAIRQAQKKWPDEEEKDEIALLKSFLWFSAIASCLIGVILFALENHSWM
jgi:hypothetical protein